MRYSVEIYEVFQHGCAGCQVQTYEKTFFAYHVAPGDVGVLSHFWTTYLPTADAGMIYRYYIDGENEPSITFDPSMACGVGFSDITAPWGNKWFGAGASPGWYNNFRVPFQKSLRITLQHTIQTFFYMIARGATNLPIIIGGITLPPTAVLNQHVINQQTFEPVELVPIVNVSSGPGVFWMHTLQITAANYGVLEGCYHAFTDGFWDFPGILLSTGTEDYYDSAWYFDVGPFHSDVAGYTHLLIDNATYYMSMYRFHDNDPLFFNNGFMLTWRNGDYTDPAGYKCMSLPPSDAVKPVLSRDGAAPAETIVSAYGWVYTW